MSESWSALLVLIPSSSSSELTSQAVWNKVISSRKRWATCVEEAAVSLKAWKMGGLHVPDNSPSWLAQTSTPRIPQARLCGLPSPRIRQGACMDLNSQSILGRFHFPEFLSQNIETSSPRIPQAACIGFNSQNSPAWLVQTSDSQNSPGSKYGFRQAEFPTGMYGP